MRLLTTFLSYLLIPVLAVLPISAEVADSLQIKPLDSGSVAVAANSTSTDWFKVQVTDAAGMPVADAAVALRLPEEGPSGTFGDGSRAIVAYTDASGYAKFPPVRWGGLTGAVIVSVTAVKGETRAGLLVRQMVNPAVAAQAAAKPVFPPPFVQPSAPPAAPTGPVTPPAVTVTAKAAAPVVVTPPAPPVTQTASATQTVPGTPAPVSPKNVTTVSPAQPGTAKTAAANSTATNPTPVVSITNTSASGGSTHTGGGSNTKKWVLLAIVAAGAGLGAALAMSSHGGSAAAATPGLSIGSPTFSLGH